MKNTITTAAGKAPVAVVTGGASGIGQAVAVAFGEHGVRTVFGYYSGDPHDPNETVEAVNAVGGECIAVEADVRSDDSCSNLVRVAVETYGRLDSVVANAGIMHRAPIEEMTAESWARVLDIDLAGVMRIFRAGVPHLSDGGAMVGVSSITGTVYGWEEHSHYAAAKAGVVGLVRSLAAELGPRGIRANTVIPGVIATPQSMDEKNSLGAAGLAQVAKGVPLRRVGAPEDVARVIRFLCSPDAAYVTGTEILIDGGMTIRQPR